MATSLNRRIAELEGFVSDFLSGAFPQPSPMGYGRINPSFMKAKSINANMLDVSDLQAVAVNTGSLNANGDIVVAANGSVRSGLTSYDSDFSNAGYWIGAPGGTPKVLIGSRVSSTSPRIDWNGSALTVQGTINAESGYLKSLSVKGQITVGDTTNTGIIAAGKTSYASTASGFWIEGGGGTTPRVKIGSAGSYIDWSGSGLTIKGTINADDGYLANLSLSGVLTLSGSGTIRFNGTGNQITPTGIVTNSLTLTGGSMNIGSGTFSVDTGGNLITQNIDAQGGTLRSLTVQGSLNVLTSGNIRSGKTAYGSGTGWFLEYNAGSPRLDIGSSTSYMRWDGSSLDTRGTFRFGPSGASYLDGTVMHLESTGVETSMIEFKRSGFTPYSDILTTVTTTASTWKMTSSYNGRLSTSKYGIIEVSAQSSNQYAQLYSQDGSTTNAYVQAMTNAGAGVSGVYLAANNAILGQFERSGGTTRFTVGTAHIKFSVIASRTPADTDGLTPAAWMEVEVGANTYSIPLYL